MVTWKLQKSIPSLRQQLNWQEVFEAVLESSSLVEYFQESLKRRIGDCGGFFCCGNGQCYTNPALWWIFCKADGLYSWCGFLGPEWGSKDLVLQKSGQCFDCPSLLLIAEELAPTSTNWSGFPAVVGLKERALPFPPILGVRPLRISLSGPWLTSETIEEKPQQWAHSLEKSYMDDSSSQQTKNQHSLRCGNMWFPGLPCYNTQNVQAQGKKTNKQAMEHIY